MDHPEPDGRGDDRARTGHEAPVGSRDSDALAAGGGLASAVGSGSDVGKGSASADVLASDEVPAQHQGSASRPGEGRVAPGPSGLATWGAAVVAGQPGVTGIPPWAAVAPPATPPPTDRSRSRWWQWGAVVILAALVGAGAGGGIVAAFGNRTESTTVKQIAAGPALLNGTTDIQKVIAKVLPAVVSIDATSTAPSSGYFGGAPTATHEQGTGVIVTSGGEVVTNNHVVAGATRITVTLYGKTTSMTATLVDADPADDVALLQITGASNLPTAGYGDSDHVQVGDAVVAIGNALGLSAGTPTVTQGIISAKGRTVQAGDANSSATETLTNMFQTDAAINPGNSGGPLVDSSGKVIGMNTAVASNAQGTSEAQGIGFAIPSNKITGLLASLRNKAIDPQAQGNGFLGVDIETLTPELRSAYNFVPDQGAVVTQVTPESPAATAGIQLGDVIVSLNGKPITSADQLANAIQADHPGKGVKIGLYRGQQAMTVAATLASPPASVGS